MSKDFAKRSSKVSQSKAVSKLGMFLTGFITGVCASVLTYLWQSNPNTELNSEMPKQISSNEVKEMQWDFYEIFPKSEVKIIDQYIEPSDLDDDANSIFLLQTGSFQVLADADARRAELLLLGLDVFIQEVEIEGETWYRVMVGPLDTELARNRAQDKLAQAEIESLPLQVRN